MAPVVFRVPAGPHPFAGKDFKRRSGLWTPALYPGLGVLPRIIQ
jgi:hypothetical protein